MLMCHDMSVEPQLGKKHKKDYEQLGLGFNSLESFHICLSGHPIHPETKKTHFSHLDEDLFVLIFM